MFPFPRVAAVAAWRAARKDGGFCPATRDSRRVTRDSQAHSERETRNVAPELLYSSPTGFTKDTAYEGVQNAAFRIVSAGLLDAHEDHLPERNGAIECRRAFCPCGARRGSVPA